MALDPANYTVDELRDELTEIEDPDEVEAILAAEQDGKDRTSAKRRLRGRLNALRSEDAESGGEPAEDEDDGEDAAEENADDAAQEDDEDDADGEPAVETPSYPAADSDELVVFDSAGAGDRGQTGPPHAGHDTIHLPDDDHDPVCGASAGAKAQVVPRSSLAEEIDECDHCVS